MKRAVNFQPCFIRPAFLTESSFLLCRVQSVALGRQAVEKRVVSQDLELWLSNAPAEDGYTLLARAGRQVSLEMSPPLGLQFLDPRKLITSQSSKRQHNTVLKFQPLCTRTKVPLLIVDSTERH
jgi:hypothetical protein